MTFIKFCGMTRESDVRAACDIGVDALGFVMWPQSPRFVAVERVARLVQEMKPGITPVGVFVSPSPDEVAKAIDAGIRVLQLHGGQKPHTAGSLGAAALWLAATVDGDLADVPDTATLLLDAHDPTRHGGTGRTIDWTRAAPIAAARRVILAGGLTPANVGDAVRAVRPYGVDVASGIELQPGIKSAAAMAAFVAATREADHS